MFSEYLGIFRSSWAPTWYPICTFSHPKYASITRESLEMLFYEPSRDFMSKSRILFMFGYFLFFFKCILCVFVFSSLLLMRDRKNDFYCSFICWRKKLCCAGCRFIFVATQVLYCEIRIKCIITEPVIVSSASISN